MNNTPVYDAHDFDVVMPMYNLIEYSDNYSKKMEFYGNIVEMNQLKMLMVQLLILLKLINH